MAAVTRGVAALCTHPATCRRPGLWQVLALGLVLFWAVDADAESPLFGRRNAGRANPTRAVRDDAVQSIPFSQLDSKAKAKVQAVLADTTLFRRLPAQVIECDPDLYLFLVEHPDVVVNIWQLLGVSQLSIREVGPDVFRIAEEAGTQGAMQLLCATHDTHVYYADGGCDGPLVARPIRGRAVVVLKSGYVRETNGRHYVTCRLDAFLQVDRAGVELLTKTFQPVVGRVADLNFAQTANFLGSLSRTAEKDPDGVVRLAGKLSGVQPKVRERFVELTRQVADRAAAQSGDADARVAEQPVEQAAR